MDKRFDDFKKIKKEIVQKALKDPSFKKKLKNNPEEVFKEYGLKFPEGVKVHLHENTAKEIHLVLPLEKNIKELEDLSGGDWPWHSGCTG